MIQVGLRTGGDRVAKHALSLPSITVHASSVW